MRLRSFVSVLAATALAAVPTIQAQSSAAASQLKAGASMVDITPKQSELEHSSDVIRDHLFARVIFVDNGKTCAVLGGLDLGASRNQFIDAAVQKITSTLGCPASNILISATHTHSQNTSGLGQGAPSMETVADAIVKAATEAKAKMVPVRMGYGRTNVDLNVNRDLFNSKLEWRQEPNPQGVSDKTLSVVEFIGPDNIPVGVYMNYAMHPINFYLSGVVSADFPGEASRYIEAHFDHKTVAIFSQGTSGDQNPRLRESGLNAFLSGRVPPTEMIDVPPAPPPGADTPRGFNPAAAQAALKGVPQQNIEAYHKAIDRVGADVTMMGTLIAEKTLDLMRHDIKPNEAATIWGGQEAFTCPGRDRQDRDNPIRENGMPPYKDGADVNLKVGLLRLGDINFAWIDGEVYTNIGLKLKNEAPSNKVIIATLANGMANSGYIYSDDAYSHLSFQVIGSRLKPGCAENKIVNAALDLMHQSGE